MTDKNITRKSIESIRLDHMEKHVEKLSDDVEDIKEDLQVVKTDVSWIKKTYWIIASASVGGLIAGFYNILFK